MLLTQLPPLGKTSGTFAILVYCSIGLLVIVITFMLVVFLIAAVVITFAIFKSRDRLGKSWDKI